MALPRLLVAANPDPQTASAMGLFTRRRPDGPAAPANSRSHGGRGHAGAEPYSMATRPSFGQWLKVTWLDIVTMIIMGALGLGVRGPERTSS